MTFIDGLLWLGSAAGISVIAAASAFALERIEAFRAMSGIGKLIVSTSVAVVIGVTGTFFADLLPSAPALLSALERGWPVVLIGLSLMSQQLAHGADKAARKGKGG